MPTYKIFLASSSELAPERIAFGDKVQEINDRFVAQKKQVRFTLYKWERDTDSFADRRKQDEYSSNIENCDIFVMLYWTKVGKYSQEEYEFAYERYLSSEKPIVFVYQKACNTDVDESVKAFQYLTFVEHEQFTPVFENANALGLAFDHELQKLFANGRLSHGAAISLFGAPNELPQTFIGRKKEIAAIQQFFDREGTGKKQLLLFSDGGIGKTTLAANYWIQNQHKYGYCAWLFCENGIVNGMEAIGAANMKNFAELTSEYKEAAILSYLNSFTNTGKCLLVLDNVNEQKHFIEWREKYGGLPWDVLITSRVNSLTTDEMPVKAINVEDALELFYSYYKPESREKTGETAYLLVNKLNGNTLLVELFAKNLDFAARAGETLGNFYKKFEAKGLGFINDNTPVETRYTANIHKRAATVPDIMNVLYDMTVLAPEDKNMLQLLALLPSGNYSNDLLFELFEPSDRKTCLINLSHLNAWMQLYDDGIQLSPLVQEMVLYKCNGQLPDGHEALIEKLSELIDDDIKPIEDIIKTYQLIAEGVLAACTKITPHYSNALYNLMVDLQHLKKHVLHLQSDINVSYQQLKQYIRKEEAGEGHSSDLIDAYILFVGCCYKLYYFEEALYYQQVVINIKKVNPSDEKGITNALEKAGDICYDWGKYELSANYYQEAYENYPQQYSTGSIKEASWKNSFAMSLRGLGGIQNLEYAEALLREAEKAYIIIYGEESTDVAATRSNLASVLENLGGDSRLMEAESLLRESLKSEINNYGEDHRVVAVTRSNLAMVLKDLGGETSLKEAEELLREALKSEINSYGKDYHGIAVKRSNLAMVLKDLGGETNLREAEGMLREALTSDIGNFGEDHHQVALKRSNLADVLQDLGGHSNLIEAESLLQEDLRSEINNYGEDHPKVAISLNNLAHLLPKINKLAEAETLLRRALIIDEIKRDENDPKIPHRLNNLCTVLIMQGKLDEAKPLLERAWHLESGQHDFTSVRILFIQLTAALLEAKAVDIYVGKLKTLLAQGNLSFYGNISRIWDIGYFVEYLTLKLPTRPSEFLSALSKVLNNRILIEKLNEYQLWKETVPVSLD